MTTVSAAGATHLEIDGRRWPIDEVRRALSQLAAPVPPPYQHGNATDLRIVAAMRWDYEHRLFSRGQVVKKYSRLVGACVTREILRRNTHRFIEGSYYPLHQLENIMHRITPEEIMAYNSRASREQAERLAAQYNNR